MNVILAVLPYCYQNNYFLEEIKHFTSLIYIEPFFMANEIISPYSVRHVSLNLSSSITILMYVLCSYNHNQAVFDYFQLRQCFYSYSQFKQEKKLLIHRDLFPQFSGFVFDLATLIFYEERLFFLCANVFRDE